MQIGKIPNNILDKVVIGKLRKHDARVVSSSAIGEDCGVLDLGENHCIISCDPITGASKNIGKIAVHVACNDIATCGIRPTAILTTILLPPESTEADLEEVIDDITKTADSLKISIIGGHTEVTDVVNQILISITSIGISKPGEYISKKKAQVGDSLVMTKTAALEGTSIIAAEHEEELIRQFGKETVNTAKSYSDLVSVIEDGVTAGLNGAHAMHDITEGGIFGAAWEIAEASQKGVLVYQDQIPVTEETKKICSYFKVDFYRLVSSGSMLIATDNPAFLIACLEEIDVKATIVGKILENPDERYILTNGLTVPLQPPTTDEIYILHNR